MKRILVTILIVFLFVFSTENRIEGGIFKTTKNKSVDQKIIELNDDGSFVGYKIINWDTLYEGHSGQIILIKTGTWKQKGKLIVIKNTNPEEFLYPRIVDYFMEVCDKCVSISLFESDKDSLGTTVIDTIDIINTKTIKFREEIYHR